MKEKSYKNQESSLEMMTEIKQNHKYNKTNGKMNDKL